MKSAHPVLWLERAIGVELTEEGAAAMIAATTPMHRGRDRLAILIEGRLHSDPVIQSVPLGASFLIEGLTDYDDRQFANLIHGMMGREPLAAQEEPIPPAAGPEPPQAKLEPYTEEEFKAIRERRERMGIHQLDRLPDQAELDKTLHRGMTADEVIAIFGKPSRHNRKAGRRDFHFEYEIAPERRPDKSAGNMTPEGFKVEFRDDKVVSWGASLWSSAPRELKNESPETGLLRGVFPEIDLADEDLDFVVWVEGIRIPDLNQAVSQSDLAALLGMLFSVNITGAAGKEDTIRADCDVLRILGEHVPELAELTAAAKGGRIPLSALRAELRPFILGGKPIPDPKPAADK